MGMDRDRRNRMRKSKNRSCKWLAALLTAALLVGQCNVSALAKEETAPAETEILDDSEAGTQEEGADVTDEDVPKDGEDDESDKCVCETACTEDAVNADCPVCAADYSVCAKNEGGG